MIRPRQNSSPIEEIERITTEMCNNGWQNLECVWDEKLNVWRVTGEWKSQKREGRGSTQLHAYNVLHNLTPKNA